MKLFQLNKDECPNTLKCLLFSLLFIANSPLFAQNSEEKKENADTLLRKELPEVFITATRSAKTTHEVPSRIHSIDKAQIEALPAVNVDALLQMIPGANIDRHQGIYSKNSGITLRGLNGTPRTLILIDGVPISKTDGGGVNWNRIVSDNIEKIEVVKGPASSVYGGNAIAGVINIITRKPSVAMEGKVSTFFGTYNTTGGSIQLGGKLKPENMGIYYNINAFYRRGDGYIIMPEYQRDSLDVRTYLWETGFSAKFGYRHSENGFSEIEYTYFNDKRGDGTKIFEEDGGYNRYPTNYLRFTVNESFGKTNWVLRYFYQNENYLRQSESMSAKKNNKYILYNTDATRIDQGMWTNFNYKPIEKLDLTYGLDIKLGSVDAADTYLTSTDVLINKGKMDFIALFATAEWKAFSEKLIISAGLRYDAALFFDGAFIIETPTTLSGFMTEYPTDFKDDFWDGWSPKAGVKYFIGKNSDIYLSYSRGFRPGMLDDMCRNGNISKGFKLANPELDPETADNYEAGASIRLFEKLTIEPSVYQTIGHDFHYFVGNGDSVYTGGNNLKPVLQRQNVSGVKVLGFEATANLKFSHQLSFIANYAYNDSRITDFDTTGWIAKNLSGKFLMEVPENQFFAGLFYDSKILNATIVFNYKDSQWVDDENTQKSPAYNTVNLKIGRDFRPFNASITVMDLFDSRYLDSKGNISPGRFFMINISYSFLKI
ncbi:MAG TPA: TonB-dependent receptor [Lentimicrobium sp.]|nr:TonB-dependent receptor [Lentimicrobium sp.]